MEQTKHTQEPWISDGLWIVGGIPEEPVAVCKLMKNAGQSVLANGNLITSAPELLQACKDFVFLEKTAMTKRQMRLQIDITKGIIAKAESSS